MKRERAVEPEGHYTYCEGPQFKSGFSITTKTIVDLVHALGKRFGKGYEFNLEPISEGGIQMISWPGKEYAHAYKTMRFHVDGGRWPWITEHSLNEWQNNTPVVIWKLPPAEFKKKQEPVVGELFFKAFNGAPCWTFEEVALIVDAFESTGFKCPKSHIPKRKNLQSYGKLGGVE